MTSQAIVRRAPALLPAAPDLRAMRAAEDHTTPERPTIAAIVAQYVEWKRGTAAKHTMRTYRDALRHFAEFLAMSGIDAFAENADALPATILEAHITWLRQRPTRRTGQPPKPTTVAVYHAAVLDLFKYAVRRHLVPEERFRWAEMAANAAETLGKVPKRSARHDRRIPLLVAFVDNLPLDGGPRKTCSAQCWPSVLGKPCDHPPRTARAGQHRLELLRDRVLLHLLLSSGMRREEVLSLNRADVEDGWSTSAVIVGKGSKERTVFWDAETQHAIKLYLAARFDTHPPLFIRLDNHRGAPGADGERWRLSPQAAWKIVRHYSAAANIPATPHAFRHAMASTMLNNGAPISLIQDLLGHSSPTVTRQVYAAYEQRTLRKGFDAYNPSASDQVADLQAEQERRRG